MKQITCVALGITAGALLAGQFGVMVVVVACIGGVSGIFLTSALGKPQAVGGFAGTIVALIIYAIIGFASNGSVRCETGDPVDYPPVTHPAGYVYVIQDVDISQLYKIGRTVNPKDRLNRFGVELPFTTDLVAIIPTQDAPTLEWQMHQRYAASRKRGEWFELTAAQVREICSV